MIERLYWAASAVSAWQENRFASSFGVGFAFTNEDFHPVRDKRDVRDLERCNFAAPESTAKCNKQQRLISCMCHRFLLLFCADQHFKQCVFHDGFYAARS